MNVSLDTNSVTAVSTTDADRTAIGDEGAIGTLQNAFVGNAGAGAFSFLSQKIEKVRNLAGKTVTVSFWAKAAAGTPKIGINIAQNFGTGGSPSSQVRVLATGNAVTLTTSWARYSTTIAILSIVGKTLGTSGDDSTQLELWWSSGASLNAAAGNIGVQSGTIQLWGVQLEVGSVATPLEKPDPQQDLAKCQRFYQQVSASARFPAVNANTYLTVTVGWQQMRAIPTNALVQAGTAQNTLSATFTAVNQNSGSFMIAAGGAGDVYSLNNIYSLTADL